MDEIRLNPEQLKAFKNAITEITNSMTRIDAENELIKDICDVQKQKYGVQPTITKKVATMVHKQNLQEESDKFEAIVTLTESVMN